MIPNAVREHLQQPFSTEQDRLAFWAETGTRLVHSRPPADAVLEYTESIPPYYISLVITSDDGAGIYYLYHGFLIKNHCKL